MQPQFQAVIFDFDYTLADSSKGVVECINYALTNLGLPAASPEAIYTTIGLSLADTLARLTGQRLATQSREFAGLFTRHADEVMTASTVLYDSVPPAIQRLKKRGLKLGKEPGEKR